MKNAYGSRLVLGSTLPTFAQAVAKTPPLQLPVLFLPQEKKSPWQRACLLFFRYSYIFFKKRQGFLLVA